jgi:hypothetical protein
MSNTKRDLKKSPVKLTIKMISKTGKATTNDHLLLKRLEVEKKRDDEGSPRGLARE